MRSGDDTCNCLDDGVATSVYTLDTTDLTQLTKDDGTPLLIRLQPGQTFQLPGGRGSITFDRVQRFAGLSARVDPGKELTLVAAVTTILGLVALRTGREGDAALDDAPARPAPAELSR